RQATTLIQQFLSGRPNVERLNLDKVLSDRGIECPLEPLSDGRLVSSPNLASEKDVFLEQTAVSQDCAVRVCELIDLPPFLALRLVQWTQHDFGACLSDQVGGAIRRRLKWLWPEEGGEISPGAEVIRSRLVDVVELRIHYRVLGLDAQQYREQIVCCREKE